MWELCCLATLLDYEEKVRSLSVSQSPFLHRVVRVLGALSHYTLVLPGIATVPPKAKRRNFFVFCFFSGKEMPFCYLYFGKSLLKCQALCYILRYYKHSLPSDNPPSRWESIAICGKYFRPLAVYSQPSSMSPENFLNRSLLPTEQSPHFCPFRILIPQFLCQFYLTISLRAQLKISKPVPAKSDLNNITIYYTPRLPYSGFF